MSKEVLSLLLLAVAVLSTSGFDICEQQKDGTRLPHPADCSSYVVCEREETANIAKCPTGLHFNRDLGECDFKHKAGCQQRQQISPIADDTSSDCTCCCSCCDSSTTTPNDTTTTTPGGNTESTPPTGITNTTPGGNTETTPPTGITDTTPGGNTETTPPTGITDTTPGGNTENNTTTPNSEVTTPGGIAEDTTTAPSTGPSGISCNNPGVCEEQADGAMFPDNSTTGYIVCQCGCEIPMPCPNGTIYNSTLETCAFDMNTICGDTLVYNATTGQCDYSPNSGVDIACPNNVTVCQNQMDGTLYPVEGVCNQFYECNYGCAVLMDCPNNLIFNTVDNYCDYPQNYNCPWPYTPPSGPSAGPSGISCPSGGGCVGQDEGTFLPSPTNCSEYIVCVCECEVQMSCPDGLYFNSTINTCDYPSNVNCTN